MHTLVADEAATRGRGRRENLFFSSMSIVIVAIVVWGFGPGYVKSLAPPGLPVWVHLHGAAMAAWIVLFAVQPWLVRRHDLALHRRLGWLSVGLVAAMIGLAATTSVLAIRLGHVPPFFTPVQMICADVLNLGAFTALYVAGILLRRRADWPKRLMTCAAVMLSWPALVRLVAHLHPGMAVVVPLSIVALLVLALAGPAFELGNGRPTHPAYRWNLVGILLLWPVYAGCSHIAVLQAAIGL